MTVAQSAVGTLADIENNLQPIFYKTQFITKLMIVSET